MLERHYLLDKKVTLFQPSDGYHASIDAVFLAAAVKHLATGAKVLDAGSGTGAVALCLAERFKAQNPQITGIEQQELLSEAATQSAAANGFDNVSFITGDLFRAPLAPLSFDCVVTNPPYALSDTPSPNPSKAAAHNFSETTLSEWLGFCLKLLKPKGLFCTVNRAEALGKILEVCGTRLGQIEVFPIYSKEGQDAKRVVISGKKGSKSPLILHSGLVVHGADGIYSPEAEAVLRDGRALLSSSPVMLSTM